jgi:hypothetical protein
MNFRSRPGRGPSLLKAALICLAMMVASPGSSAVPPDTGLIQRNVSAQGPVPLAILGDSDSEAYAGERGGLYAVHTFGWSEVLGHLRPQSFDLGPWGSWGLYGKLADAWRASGIPLTVRGPRKFDYQNNFAIGGAHCSDLFSGWREVPRLLELMANDPARWERGIVVIRIGVNDIAKYDRMDRLAANPRDEWVHARYDECVKAINRAVLTIQAAHPGTRFVIVGMFNLAHWPTFLDRWRSAAAMVNISQGLDDYDNALRALAARDPSRIAFFDDRAFFQRHWGGRKIDGTPDYHPYALSPGFSIHNAVGDEPSHTALEDDHCGAAWNAMWAQDLIALLNTRFGIDAPPLANAELLHLLGVNSVTSAP